MARAKRVVDLKDEAQSMRETFQDARMRRQETMSFSWPAEMQSIGRCLSVIYTSDKWKSAGEFEDYKHIAEAPQYLLAIDGFLVDWTTDDPLEVIGPRVQLPDPMPRHFAKLAKLLGVQVRLYETMGKSGKGVLSKNPENLLEFRVGGAFLGGSYVPDEDEMRYPAGIGLGPGDPFLFVFTLREGVKCIITGKELDVEADGIVG